MLTALAALRAEDGEGEEPVRPHGLGDLEELLSRGPGNGTLILEYGRVPGEDIGFVRRFLERHPAWRLLVVGEDAQAPSARGLLGLPRAQWLPWPPDLEQLRVLLDPPTSPPPARGSAPKPAPDAPPSSSDPAAPTGKGEKARDSQNSAATAPPAPAPPPAPELDVGGFFEELLAGAALAGEGAPRYLFRCDQPVVLQWDRQVLAEVLSRLLSLARRCAGEDGVVSAQVDPARADSGGEEPSDESGSGEEVRLRIDFPVGPLTDGDLPGLLEAPFEGADELADEVRLARTAAERLRQRGGRARLVPHQAGRLRLELILPRIPRPAVDEADDGIPQPPPADQGSPEDPFA